MEEDCETSSFLIHLHNTKTMKKYLLTYRTAAILSLGITLLIYLVFLIMFFFGRDAIMPPGKIPRPEHDFDIYRMLIGFIANFIFTFSLFVINFKILLSEKIRKYKLFILVITVIIVTIILSYALISIQMHFFDFGPPKHHDRFIFGNMVRDFMLTIVIVFTSQILYLSYRKQQIALENETLIAENVKTRYIALKNQMDPHFLFNTLNSLNSMIKLDPEKAQEYVQKFSAVFRYTLQDNEVVTLENELKFTKDYCSLMQIRYGESLIFQFDIDKKLYACQLVPLSIQTLVENAIKHNVITKRQPLTIRISTADNNTLTVSNHLQLKKEVEPGEGIGLSNLTERYRLKWQKEIEVKCNMEMFQVTLPLIAPDK